jgi:hypothetical protein
MASAASDTCTPPAVDNNWAITAADMCVKTGEVINIGRGNITVTGVGVLRLVNTNISSNRIFLIGDGTGSAKISLEQGSRLVQVE